MNTIVATKTLTNNKFIDSSSGSKQSMIRAFMESIVKLFNEPDGFDYNQTQINQLKSIAKNNLVELFYIWAHKIGFDVDNISTITFLNYKYQYVKLLEEFNPNGFVILSDYIDTVNGTKTIFVNVGDNYGFKNKSQAVLHTRKLRKAGQFKTEYATNGRTRLKYFENFRVLKVNDLGFDWEHRLMEFIW